MNRKILSLKVNIQRMWNRNRANALLALNAAVMGMMNVAVQMLV